MFRATREAWGNDGRLCCSPSRNKITSRKIDVGSITVIGFSISANNLARLHFPEPLFVILSTFHFPQRESAAGGFSILNVSPVTRAAGGLLMKTRSFPHPITTLTSPSLGGSWQFEYKSSTPNQVFIFRMSKAGVSGEVVGGQLTAFKPLACNTCTRSNLSWWSMQYKVCVHACFCG